MSVATTVDQKIASKKVIMYSKSYCPFCTKAKKAFQDLLNDGTLSKNDYEVVEIENDPNCDAIQDYMKTKTGGRSVPRVFINGKFIGGGDETAQMKSTGKLTELVKA